MSDQKTYAGSCHCGAIRFEMKTDLARVIACNCSICARAGMLFAFVPASDFALLSGADQMEDYQFGKMRLHHPFCKVCGIHAYSHGVRPDGAEMRAVNVRCLEGVDVSSLTPTPFDGRSL